MEINKTQENTSFVINETKRPNSFEVGSAGNRHKIYYDTVEELQKILNDLREANLY